MADDLLEIRQQFIRLSGRYDLATTTADPFDTDNGANWFINAGVRWLDLQQEHLLSTQEFQLAMSSGDWEIDMQYLRAPLAVYYTDADSETHRLKERSFDWIIANYPELGDTTVGTPRYWASFIATRAPTQVGSGLTVTQKRVVIMPPTNADITAKVYGRFHQLKLSDNDDTNFWTTEYPDVLVLAALMSLESFYRNTQGVSDYRNAILSILVGIDRDTAESGEEEPQQMEG
jgi:hypothetical protein